MKALLGTAALLFTLAGCSDNDDTNNEDAGGPESMRCDDIWVEGEMLPEDYDGCETPDSIVAAVTVDCADGTKFTSYGDRLYAKLGEEIFAVNGEMAADPAYSAFHEECTAG
jgi:hypothetical protein